MSAVNLTLDQSLAFDRALSSATGFARDAIVFDRQTLRRFDVDGRMHVERCNISKANVCPYFGREIPDAEALGLDPNRIYKLYRDPQELERAALTFRNVQLLMLHTAVNADDPKTEVTVGTIGSDVRFEAPYLTASIAVWTQEAIQLIESKQQAELSSSYRYRPDMTPGVTPEGVAYDGVMRDIMANHVALVEKGRAGPDVYVSDSLPEFLHMKRSNLVAAVIAALSKAGATVALSNDAQLALDAALDAEMKKAEDEAKAAADKKAKDEKEEEERKARDASAAVTPGPKEGERGKSITADSLPSLLTGYVTKADADRMASDAGLAAVVKINALHKARKDVEPLVGVVAFDSAEEVYRFALDQAKVAIDGVPPAAFGALVEQVKAARTARTSAVPTPKIAMDAANAVTQAIPGLGRFG